MPHKTNINWTFGRLPDGTIIPGYSSNPIKARLIETPAKVGWACTKLSPACVGCYAEEINMRFGTGLAYSAENEHKIEMFLDQKELEALAAFTKCGVKVFMCDMTDIFHRKVADKDLWQLFDVMEGTSHFTKMILTKRPQRMLSFLRDRWVTRGPASDEPTNLRHIPPHIWGGVTVERQNELWRAETLMNTPFDVRYLSCEPLVGDINLRTLLQKQYRPGLCRCGHDHPFTTCKYTGRISERCHIKSCHCEEFRTVTGIRFVIVGGENRRIPMRARPMHPEWARHIRDACEAMRIKLFFKGWGTWQPFATHAAYADGTEYGGSCGGPATLADFKTVDGNTYCRATWSVGDTTQERRALMRKMPDHKWGKENALWMTYLAFKGNTGRILDGVVHDYLEPANGLVIPKLLGESLGDRNLAFQW